MSKCEILNSPHKQFTQKSVSENASITEYISNYTKNTHGDVTIHTNQTLNMNLTQAFVLKFMKTHCNLSYQRVKSRPNTIDFGRIFVSKTYFTIRFPQIIDRDTLIVNVDESSINRHMKSMYSWGIRGRPIEAQNSPFAGSFSLVTAI